MDTHPELTVSIRRAVTGDIPGIQRVLVDTWHASYDAIMGAGEVDRKIAQYFGLDRLDGMVNSTSRNSWAGVAHNGHAVLGFATAAFSFSGRLTVWTLYVHPRYQQRGIGTQFLYAIAEAFPFARSVFVETLEANAAAIRFYQRNGFRPLGSITDPARANVAIMGMMQTVPNGPTRIGAAKFYLANCL